MGIDGASTRTIKDNEIRVKTISGQPRPQKPVLVEAWGEIDAKKIKSWKRELINKNTTTKQAVSIKKIAQSKLKESRVGNNPIFPIFAYHGTGRLWAEHEKVNYQKQEEGVLMAYRNCLSAKSSSKEFLSWYKTQEDQVMKFEQDLDKAHLQAFKNTIMELIPDERWQDMAFDRKTDELTGIFTDDKGQKHKLKYSQLSDGFRNIIGMAADIAYRCIQLNPHLGIEAVKATPGVVLIDELDLHLHPKWQRRIVGDLKRVFPNIQFVATTHSPFIVQSLSAEELYNLDQVSVGLSPDDYSLEIVAYEMMGVESNFSREQEALEYESIDYFELLAEAEKSEDKKAYILRLKKMEDDISHVGLRAYLKSHRIAKNLI